MSTLAKFGPKTFQVGRGKLYTFEGLTRTGALSTEKKEVTGKKPATAIKGPGLDQLKLTAQLWLSLGIDPQAEVESWLALKDAGVPYPFLLGSAALGVNKYLLTRCDASYTSVGGDGVPLAVKLSLTFDEYLPPGVQTVGQTGGAAVGLSAADPYQVAGYTAHEKAAGKRPGNLGGMGR